MHTYMYGPYSSLSHIIYSLIKTFLVHICGTLNNYFLLQKISKILYQNLLDLCVTHIALFMDSD